MISKQKGISLYETLGVVSILSAVVFFAVPSINHYLHRQNIRAHTSAVHDLIKTARIHATQTGKPVVLCGTQDYQKCAHGEFKKGMMAFVDHNHNAKYDQPDVMLGGVTQTEDGLNLAYKGFPYKNVHIFSVNDNITSNGSFLISHPDAETGYKIAISKTGNSTVKYI